jgi:hypothetical protein
VYRNDFRLGQPMRKNAVAPRPPAGRARAEGEEVNPLGLALMVGAALLVSGLVFLLPVRRKQLQQEENFQESKPDRSSSPRNAPGTR